MNAPEHKAKVHTPETAKKIGLAKKAWLSSGSPSAVATIERIRALNPSLNPETRAKISRRLKEIGHGPSVRGGNGRGMTVPQSLLLDALGSPWRAEFVLPLGASALKLGYPTHYKIDLANPDRKLAIEVDGFSHGSRRHIDVKKDEKLRSLGWTVLRFLNQDIPNWIASGRPMGSYISTTLEAHGIRLSA